MNLMSDLDIVTTQAQGRNGPVTLMAVGGRINLSNTEKLSRRAQEAYDGGARSLLLDLTASPSITSAGLRAILAIYRLFEPTGGEAASSKSPHIKLVVPDSHTRHVMSIAGFDSYIDVFEDRASALEAF